MDLISYALNRIARNHAQQAILQQATQSVTQQATLPTLSAPLSQVTEQKRKRNEKTRR